MIALYVLVYLCVGYVVMCLAERFDKSTTENAFSFLVLVFPVAIIMMIIIQAVDRHLPEEILEPGKLRKWIRGF